MAGEIIDGVATLEGRNVFANVSTLGDLVSAFGGFSAMCWENPKGAGEFQGEEATATANAFAERANDILWTRMYQQFQRVLREWFPADTDAEIDACLAELVKDMNLWG